MTTEISGIILYSVIESALPVNILCLFEWQKKIQEKEQELSSLDAIILFIKKMRYSHKKK